MCPGVTILDDPFANATLTLDNVQATNAGTYAVIVTNSAGSAISSNALLTVSTGNSKPQVSAVIFTNGTFGLTAAGDAGLD